MRPLRIPIREATPSTRRILACLTALLAGPVAAATLDEARELYRAGRLDAAVASYREVAEATRADDPETAARARNNACVILMNTGDYPAALKECREALVLRHRTGDAPRLARTLNNTGIALQHLGRFVESASRYREALAINTQLDDAQGQTINHASLGVVATEAGWYSEAIEQHERALELARRHADQPWAREQVLLAQINRAVVLERLGAFREALELYRNVLDDREQLPPNRRATLSLNVGVVYRNLGDPVRAAAAFESAIESYREIGDRSGLSTAYLDLGIVRHLNLGQPAEAEPALRRALELAEEIGDRAEEIRDLYHLGRLLVDLGRLDEARALFERSLRTAVESRSSEGQWVSLEGLARIDRARGDLAGALGRLLGAIDEIERVRESLGRSSLRSDYFGDKRSVYAAAVELLTELDDTEPGAGHAAAALELAQRAKARTLLDAIGPGDRRGAPLQSEEMAELVGDDLMLEYFLGETRLVVWVVYRGAVVMHVLGDHAPVTETVRRVHRALARGEDPPGAALKALGRTLLGRALAGPLPASHVRIAPDGLLHYLPFELLGLPGEDGVALIDRATVSYLPSGSALGWVRGQASDRGLVLIGFGNPGHALAVSPSSPAGRMTTGLGLRPLAAVEEEIVAVGGMLPGGQLMRLGDEATEEAFARDVARGARVVHVAAHAVVDERRQRSAAIVLAPGERSDGLMYPEEIAALVYPVDLTVLAACRTALSSEGGRDALTTLTGSFLAAGSSAVVATLWEVEDSQARVFMEQFYHQLGRGLEPATALRSAKQRLRRDPQWNRGSIWAAYILVGDTGPVAPRSRFLAWALALGGFTAAVVLGWIAARRACLRV